MADKQEPVILFPDVPELTWTENPDREYRCRQFDCKELLCGMVCFKGRQILADFFCLKHAKEKAIEILEAIVDDARWRESCRDAYNKIMNEKR